MLQGIEFFKNTNTCVLKIWGFTKKMVIVK